MRIISVMFSSEIAASLNSAINQRKDSSGQISSRQFSHIQGVNPRVQGGAIELPMAERALLETQLRKDPTRALPANRATAR
jgi:hypothetical protein